MGQKSSHWAVANHVVVEFSQKVYTHRCGCTGLTSLEHLQRKQQQDPLSIAALATENTEVEEGIRVQIPVDVAVEEPRARVVGLEADGDLIICVASANAYNVAHHRVDPVVRRAVRAMDYVECMLVGAV